MNKFIQEHKRGLKIIGGIIMAPVVLIALVVGYYAVENFKEDTEKEKVKMIVKYDPEVCSEEFPLLVVAKNNSSRTVKKIDFDVEVRRKGYSNDLSGILTNYSSDKIIAPGEYHGTCWKYRLKKQYEQYNDPNNLEFEIDYKYVYFQK